MKKLDIVYVLNTDLVNSELFFSLRSVAENFPHRKVWFYGGQPTELVPDERAAVPQIGGNRYERVRSLIKAACENKKLTADFWLFNDDFYVLQEIDELEPWYNGTLLDHAEAIKQRHGGQETGYTKQLRKTAAVLEEAGKSTLNYAVHAPMKINRKKMLQTLERFPDCPMLRALYGNDHEIGGEDAPDVKIVKPDERIPDDWRFASTSDASFVNGIIGEQIRKRFTEPSPWEK